MVIELEVNCCNCDAEIIARSLHVSDGEVPRVNVFEFSQTSWTCPKCGHVTCIGDIDTIDEEEL